MSIREHSRKSVTLITGISLLFGDFFVPLQLMKRASYIFLIVLMLAACGGWRDGQRLLDRADSLLYGQPDSALRLLDSITEDDQERMSEAQLMRYHLLRADAQNKCFVPFTTDSVMKEVAHYYERKGTPNEQMRAYYLLGRAYYDMGETPMALKYFHEAADCADTTQTDCDFKLLSRVHGQMGRLFLDQDALRSALEEFENAKTFSLRCHDSLSYLSFCNQKSPILDKLNLPDSAINNSLTVSKCFLSSGHTSLAANAIGNVIGTMVRQNRLKEAKEAIRLYEEKSGLFDSVQNISKGKEIYYYVKGNYYIASKHPDSSLYCFRKLIDKATSFNHLECGYLGLSRVYEMTGKIDSALKYSKLAYSYNDSSHRKKITEYYTRNQNSYKYSRQQKLAEQKGHEAINVRYYWGISSLVLLAVIVFAVFQIARNSRKTHLMQKKLKSSYSELNKQTSEYNQLLIEKNIVLGSLQEMQKAQVNMKEEYIKIEKAYKTLETTKQSEIIEKEILISILETKLGQKSTSQVNDRLAKATIVQELHKQERGTSPSMTSDQWKALKTSVDEIIPHLSVLIEEKYPSISREELQIVYLTKVGFKSGQSMRLLERTGATAYSMKKGRLVKKLFGLNEDGAKLFNTLIANFG